MSATYQAVGWNRFKKRYDLFLAFAVVLFLVLFIRITFTLNPDAFPPVVLMRAFGTAAILLLHLILIIGPLARLDTRWLPVLYNRRHLGVCMFLVGLLHGVAAMLYHIGGDVFPILSVFLTDAGPSIAEFPFQAFGFLALLIFFVMAATSHDFWLANLTAPVWKSLHMLVYVAYVFVMIHVVFGILQAEKSPLYIALYAVGFVTVAGLHFIAGAREGKKDHHLEKMDSSRCARSTTFLRIRLTAASCREKRSPSCAGRARSPLFPASVSTRTVLWRKVGLPRDALHAPGTAINTTRTPENLRLHSPKKSRRSMCGCTKGKFLSTPNRIPLGPALSPLFLTEP